MAWSSSTRSPSTGVCGTAWVPARRYGPSAPCRRMHSPGVDAGHAPSALPALPGPGAVRSAGLGYDLCDERSAPGLSGRGTACGLRPRAALCRFGRRSDVGASRVYPRRPRGVLRSGRARGAHEHGSDGPGQCRSRVLRHGRRSRRHELPRGGRGRREPRLPGGGALTPCGGYGRRGLDVGLGRRPWRSGRPRPHPRHPSTSGAADLGRARARPGMAVPPSLPGPAFRELPYVRARALPDAQAFTRFHRTTAAL